MVVDFEYSVKIMGLSIPFNSDPNSAASQHREMKPSR